MSKFGLQVWGWTTISSWYPSTMLVATFYKYLILLDCIDEFRAKIGKIGIRREFGWYDNKFYNKNNIISQLPVASNPTTSYIASTNLNQIANFLKLRLSATTFNFRGIFRRQKILRFSHFFPSPLWAPSISSGRRVRLPPPPPLIFYLNSAT